MRSRQHRAHDRDRLVALRRQWETFQEDGRIVGSVRPEIAASWRRSREHAVESALGSAPLDEAALRGFDSEGQARRQFAAASRTLADHLASEIGESDAAAVIVCTSTGVLQYRTGSHDILRRTERLNLVRGGVWDERRAGTNGIGLALELGRVTHVAAAEHHVEAFHGFACAAAPIRHPVTREVLGVLDLTTDCRRPSSFVTALVARAARDAEQLIEEQVFGRERELLERYLRGRAESRKPFLTVDRSGHTIIQNAQMLQSVPAEDVETLLGIARDALRAERDATTPLELSIGHVEAEVALVRSGAEVIGALISCERGRRRRASAPEPGPDWSPIVGRSAAMQRLLRDAAAIARRRPRVLVRGEPGTGKLLLARSLHRVGGTGPCTVVSCAAPDWHAQWRAAAAAGGSVVLRRVHALDAQAQLLLADELDGLDGAAPAPWTIALLNERAEPPGTELLSRLAGATLTVPPLRDRDHDVGLLVRDWCARWERESGSPTTVRQEARDALAAQPWPGNVRQLLATLDAAALRAGSVIGVEALQLELAPSPAGDRFGPRPLHEIEREAIAQALARNGGNVSRTARELGIGRATLHRRLRSYRLLGGDGRAAGQD